ncbi:hypothetical protein BGZ63DRAFT_159893 [Mariannaea sp. PMI_226]|nr:hypothetical protein BGZ63DRAFT_159893 [Mariannaea sp. PMI_226]
MERASCRSSGILMDALFNDRKGGRRIRSFIVLTLPLLPDIGHYPGVEETNERDEDNASTRKRAKNRYQKASEEKNIGRRRIKRKSIIRKIERGKEIRSIITYLYQWTPNDLSIAGRRQRCCSTTVGIAPPCRVRLLMRGSDCDWPTFCIYYCIRMSCTCSVKKYPGKAEASQHRLV